MRLSFPILFAITLLVPALPSRAAIDREAASGAFEKANTAFNTGEYKEAAALYEELLASGHYSANLYYNLGNSWFRLNEPGRAALNFQRALLLNPQHLDARKNLDFVRNSKGLEPIKMPLLSISPVSCNANQLFVITTVLFWVMVFSFSAWVLWRNAWTGWITTVSLLLLIFLGWQSIGCRNSIANEKLAVVVSDKVPLRPTANDSAGPIMTLPAASNVRIESERDAWIYTRTDDGQKGWVPAGSVQRVADAG